MKMYKPEDEIRAALFRAASSYSDYISYKADMLEKYSAQDDMIAEMWKAGKRTFSDIAADAGLSADAMARKYGIPYGTANNWRAGRKTPSYIRYMLLMCEDQI